MISGNYREIAPADLLEAAAGFSSAWQDPRLPEMQYAIVQKELACFARGEPVAPYDALVDCWRHIPHSTELNPKVLDVGASSGYYRMVFILAGIAVEYFGIDYSRAFTDFAMKTYGVRVDVGDAMHLPYGRDSFDVVLHGACIMHLHDHEQAIREAVRVSRRYVIFHRTPVFDKLATTFYRKIAYGVPVLEARYNEPELLALFRKYGLNLLHTSTVFWCEPEGYGHRSYLLSKSDVEPYASNLNV